MSVPTDFGQSTNELVGQSTEHRFEILYRISVALAAEHDRGRLVERILLEAKRLCVADGGTLYLVEGKTLRFAMTHTDSLGIAQGGSTGNPIDLAPIALFSPAGEPIRSSIATRAYHDRRPVHVADAYQADGFDQSGFRAFDRARGYRSVSLLAIPLMSGVGEVIGVLQLVNATDPHTGAPTAFAEDLQRTVEALAAAAGVALDNQQLLEDQRNLLDSFIRLLAEAIDSKSPYTGGHCERVPVLTEMVVRSLCEAKQGPFEKFQLSDEEWRELRVAAWLHDCGKVTTPVHVMDKATKLETIFDRIEIVAARMEVLKRELELQAWKAVAGGANPKVVEEAKQQGARLDEEMQFLRRVNVGGESLAQADKQRIAALAEHTLNVGGRVVPLLEPEWVENLSVVRGTLTDDERLIINEHMVQTIRMLEALPFPKNLRRVPEYAGGHHERMDGRGYPKGLYAGDMSLPARALAIADVFEALTASDRPYKPGKTLSECGQILANMKRHNHLDPELLDHCVRSGVLKAYAERFLPALQCDEWTGEEILATQPLPFELPDEAERAKRWQGFLPEYAARLRSRESSQS
jgi:HD-GYP domain-containing protein (c-di-GMP phosphodiesterase class II)